MDGSIDRERYPGAEEVDKSDSPPSAPTSPLPTPPPKTIYERGQNEYVPYETKRFQEAYQWATGQTARKFPGCVEAVETLEGLIKQYLAAYPPQGK